MITLPSILLLLLLISAGPGYGEGYVFRDGQHIIPALPLKITSEPQELTIPAALIDYRVHHSTHDPRIEAVTLKVPCSEERLLPYAAHLSAPGKEEELTQALRRLSRCTQLSTAPSPRFYLLPIDPSLAALISPQALLVPSRSLHQRLLLPSQPLRDDEGLRGKFFDEIELFLSPEERNEVRVRLERDENIEISRYLLPAFARQVIGKFSIYQGPNCFHAALAFQHLAYTQSAYFNINQEKNHHRVMINSDELWRILQRDFYPLPTATSPVKYGDILLYCDLSLEPSGGFSYRSIKHASVYLWANYTFGKASKSSYTPYVIQYFPDEWKFWQGRIKNLGIKIFRRFGNYDTTLPSPKRIDWLY